ncbi:MAG: hypothetical protein HC835_13450 [Oscillatoriales cyanobacterium RM2_1_1]|nr:hypothetical protein [Oscillatoriales cyanobacterium RM2_1_1]
MATVSGGVVSEHETFLDAMHKAEHYPGELLTDSTDGVLVIDPSQVSVEYLSYYELSHEATPEQKQNVIEQFRRAGIPEPEIEQLRRLPLPVGRLR